MATSKSKNPPALQASCDHNGGAEYWCQECAFVAAGLLKEENERLLAKIEAFNKPRGKK